MTAVSWDDQRSGAAVSVGDQEGRDRPEPTDWVAALATDGPEQAAALRQLHALMIRAAGHQVWRMRGALPDASPAAVDVIVNQAADEAMTALLRKLHTFEGRSRFTTWAFKFAILQAATEVRRLQWQHREVELRDFDLPSTPAHESPELCAEGTDLAGAVASAMRRVLTPYQRRIAIALLVDGVPIDVLAERLGTNRGALYKTLHDVRVRLRAELIANGYLSPPRAGAPGAASSHHRSRVSPNPTAGTS
ncbi:RNA polymerase sigma factor [Terrabacter sp. GCM10028922]|uniref:RNA polymerase sigma factor n=1 Tax=Terrabacter sp. GCM10028922 TaxID=3273428 RepID=UPI00361BA88E